MIFPKPAHDSRPSPPPGEDARVRCEVDGPVARVWHLGAAVPTAPGGGQRPSLAPYVTLTGPKEGATASAEVVHVAYPLVAWMLGASSLWALSALFLFSVVPITLLVIFPTNKKLHDPALQPADPAAAQYLTKWGRLHWLRTGLSFVAFSLHIAGCKPW